MPQAQKIVLSASRDIPFNKLVLSQANVRRIKAGISIEDLAEDIARRTLLQSLTVRAVRNADGDETGMFEIPAGGRRYRALERLVRQKRLAKTAPVPCVIREGGLAEEDSLAENVQRAPLHPLDQFRAFLTLRQQGQPEEEIAAAFFVPVGVVKQRLRLASVAPALLELYAEDELTLEQLMAFTVNGDHQRQMQVYDLWRQSYAKEPFVIRRMLTEGAVRASDKRARFVGLEAYQAAGGVVLRDLFERDDGGWLQDVGLLDQMVADGLQAQLGALEAEGWKWIQMAIDLPYDHAYGLRQLRGDIAPLGAEQEAEREALQAEYDRLEHETADAEDLPEAIDHRLGEIEAALARFDERPAVFDPDDKARAGVFVSLDSGGGVRIERGFVRPEDEAPVTPDDDLELRVGAQAATEQRDESDAELSADPEPAKAAGDDLPDRLLTELTAHRTLALREAISAQPELALFATLHALTLKAFYRYAQDSCLELDLRRVALDGQAPGLNDSALAVAFDARHQAWIAALPKASEAVWDALVAFDSDSRQALFAHCVALAVNAQHQAHLRRPAALAHADRLAQATGLDMVAAGWTPTVERYLGRVRKAQILDAVREGCSPQAAQHLAHLKKPDMAQDAQTLLDGSGWLPAVLRTPGMVEAEAVPAPADAFAQTAAFGGEPAVEPIGGEADTIGGAGGVSPAAAA